jgi:drug/metabolite transporter (DMT)-like permease
MLAAAAGFAGMTAAAKLAGARLPLFEIVFVRAALSVIATLALLRHARIPALGTRRPLLLLRGLFGFAGLTCSFYAVIHLPLAEATLLQFTHPLFTLVLAARLLGERLERGVLLGAPVAVLGLLVVVRPAVLFGGASAALDPFAVAVALAGAFFAADAYVTVRHLTRTGEHPLAIVLSFPFVTTFLAAPLMLREFVWPTAAEWGYLFAAGLGAQIGQMALTRGIQILPAARATIFSYTQVVFASVLGALLFGERPDAWTATGGGLVLLGAWLAGRSR